MVDTMTGAMLGQMNRGQPHRVFDWHKAARLIRERAPHTAVAGLGGDWSATADTIFRDGEPVPGADSYAYLSSNWAVPELEIDGWRTECWVYEKDTDGWDADTYWPDSALAILRK